VTLSTATRGFFGGGGMKFYSFLLHSLLLFLILFVIYCFCVVPPSMTLPPIQPFSFAPPPLSIYAIILVLCSSSSLPRHNITQPSITSFFQARSARFRHSRLHTLHPASFLSLSASYRQSLCCCLMSTRSAALRLLAVLPLVLL
jgi:hypothetical protein